MCANSDGKTNYKYTHLLNISDDKNMKYVAAVATTADILEKSFVILMTFSRRLNCLLCFLTLPLSGKNPENACQIKNL